MLWVQTLKKKKKICVEQRKDLKISGLKIQFLILSWPLMGKLFLLSESHIPHYQEEAGKLEVSVAQ